MIYLIDNYDSFTYNLYQQLESLGVYTQVFEHDHITISQISQDKPDKIIISPGPGRPKDSGICLNIIQQFYTTIPILGVCLGHQCIGKLFGVRIITAPQIMHGKTSAIYHNNQGILTGLDNPFRAARYHSLVLDKAPKDFQLTAWDKDKTIMAIAHEKYPLFGVQFHPESFMTTNGDKIIRNFLNL